MFQEIRVAVLLVTFLSLISPAFSWAGVISVTAAADNFGTGPGDGSIVGLGPDSNPIIDTFLQPGSANRKFAIEFDLSTVPQNSTLITSATLQLTAPGYADPSATFDLRGYAGNGVIELGDVQGVGNAIALLNSGLLLSDVGAIDVTWLIGFLVDAGAQYAGFQATSLNPIGSNPAVYSREHFVAAQRPTLIITTVPEPNAVAMLLLATFGWKARRRR